MINRLDRHKLKGFDRRIRIITNLEITHETIPFIGMGGAFSSVNQDKIVEEPMRSKVAAERVND
jgi:hypothetical protein